MHIGDVMDELAFVLQNDAHTGPTLRVLPYWAQAVQPPAAVISWPEEIEFDKTFRRGADAFVIPIIILVGKVDSRTARDVLSVYLDGSGDFSIKAILENYTYSSCDSIQVKSVRIAPMTVASIEYLAGEFQVHVIGKGA